MKKALAALSTAAILSGGILAVTTTQVSAAPPNCGGNATGVANNPTVPWLCVNDKAIDGVVGGLVHGDLTVDRTSNNGGVVTVVVTLPAVQAADVPVLIFWSDGVSSAPNTSSGSGVIPAGQLSVTVSTSRDGVCNGQVDVQVNRPVDFTQKSDLYRLHGPWLEVPNCTLTPTPVPPVDTSVPGTTVVGQTTTTVKTFITTGELPPTGGGTVLAIVAVFLLAGGVVLVVRSRRHSADVD